jgi:hypothetical protein
MLQKSFDKLRSGLGALETTEEEEEDIGTVTC